MFTTKKTIQENRLDSEWKYFAKPSDFKGLNKHYVNLISADVFKQEKISLFSSLKNFFLSVK